MIVMIPNFIWIAIPAPNDVLRKESVTAIIDTVGSICQVLFVSSLCIIINKERNKLQFSPLLISSMVCIILYFIGWVLYYIGFINPLVILSLTLPPCLAFIFFALERKKCYSSCSCGLFYYLSFDIWSSKLYNINSALYLITLSKKSPT